MKKFFRVVFLIMLMFVCTYNVSAKVTWKYINNPKYKTDLKNEYKKLPNDVKKTLDENDVVIILYGYNKFSKYVGLFNGDVHVETYKMNWLRSFYKRRGVNTNWSTDKLSKNYAKCTLIHELSHAYDYNSGWLSKTKEFKNIYKKEKNKIKKSDYYKFPIGSIKQDVNNEQEYFATALTMYVRSNKDLKKHCPKTYNYFKKLFNK